MTMTFQFCEMRADEEAATAKAATLDNVRERALRSESAWREMGNRLRAVQAQRRKNEQERASAPIPSIGD